MTRFQDPSTPWCCSTPEYQEIQYASRRPPRLAGSCTIAFLTERIQTNTITMSWKKHYKFIAVPIGKMCWWFHWNVPIINSLLFTLVADVFGWILFWWFRLLYLMNEWCPCGLYSAPEARFGKEIKGRKSCIFSRGSNIKAQFVLLLKSNCHKSSWSEASF